MRVFTIARSGVYAVIVAAGVLHLFARADAGAEQTRGPWISARTDQRHDGIVRLDGSRVVAVGMGWHGRCSNGLFVNRQYGWFEEPRMGRFERRGSRFRQLYTFSATWDEGAPYVLHGRLEGTLARGEVSGTAAFIASFEERGRTVTCASGAIAWSAAR